MDIATLWTLVSCIQNKNDKQQAEVQLAAPLRASWQNVHVFD